MLSEVIASRIAREGVIAVVILDDINHALPLCDALLEGGVSAIELTLRTPIALDAARLIKNERPDMCLGIGTVLTTDQVRSCVSVGVDFAVAPGCNPRVLASARDEGLDFAPGIMTPSDLEVALEFGCRTIKFFPAETSGGLEHLESLAAPYQHLGLSFIPLGGVNIVNAEIYLRSPLICAVGGSWVAKRDPIRNEDWSVIAQNARAIRELIEQL